MADKSVARVTDDPDPIIEKIPGDAGGYIEAGIQTRMGGPLRASQTMDWLAATAVMSAVQHGVPSAQAGHKPKSWKLDDNIEPIVNTDEIQRMLAPLARQYPKAASKEIGILNKGQGISWGLDTPQAQISVDRAEGKVINALLPAGARQDLAGGAPVTAPQTPVYPPAASANSYSRTTQVNNAAGETPLPANNSAGGASAQTVPVQTTPAPNATGQNPNAPAHPNNKCPPAPVIPAPVRGLAGLLGHHVAQAAQAAQAFNSAGGSGAADCTTVSHPNTILPSIPTLPTIKI